MSKITKWRAGFFDGETTTATTTTTATRTKIEKLLKLIRQMWSFPALKSAELEPLVFEEHHDEDMRCCEALERLLKTDNWTAIEKVLRKLDRLRITAECYEEAGGSFELRLALTAAESVTRGLNKIFQDLRELNSRAMAPTTTATARPTLAELERNCERCASPRCAFVKRCGRAEYAARARAVMVARE